MKRLHFYSILFLIISLFSCNNSNKTDKISGYIEKGPFVSGSAVKIIELNERLEPTGREFNTITTNDEGAFEINNIEFSSPYVQLEAEGYYFNEVTGQKSTSPITLNAIVDIREKKKVNVNVLTQLEMNRVKALFKTDTLSFSEAKAKAEQELMSCFYIDTTITNPETVSITKGDYSADILIAISSVVLVNKSDAKIAEFMTMISSDLEMNGKLTNESLLGQLARSENGVNCDSVKKNIIERYRALGKDISVGNLRSYIFEMSMPPLDEEDIILEYFKTEDNYISALTSSYYETIRFLQYANVVEASYTQVLHENDLRYYSQLRMINDHNVTPSNSYIAKMWANAYIPINKLNQLIKAAQKPENAAFKKYIYPALTLRAYLYSNLIFYWGDVPFITEDQLSGENLSNLTRQSQDNILSILISDLTLAKNNLSTEIEANTKMYWSYFAAAQLMRINLYQKKYNDALYNANLIINSEVFTLPNDRTADYKGWNITGTIFPLYTESTQLINEYSYLVKQGSIIPVVKYAEILLSAAESNLQLNNLSDANRILNLFRAQAGVSPISTNATKEDLKQYIIDLWKSECGKDGLYFFALKRLDLSEQALNINSYQNLLPIPNSEIATYPSITQNPGY